MTCVGATVEQLRDYLRRAVAEGVENVVALRGDPPRGDDKFRPVPGGLSYANELVGLIRGEFAACGIAVAGYPETHQEAPSPQVDLVNLKRKVAAGADVVITQLFYDNADFFAFRQRCQELGIDVPIVPGLLPITNFAQIKRITALCGAKLPVKLVAGLEAAGDDAEKQFDAGSRVRHPTNPGTGRRRSAGHPFLRAESLRSGGSGVERSGAAGRELDKESRRQGDQ